MIISLRDDTTLSSPPLQLPLAQETLAFKNKGTSSLSLGKNRAILDGYFKSQGKSNIVNRRGLLMMALVTSWRENRAGTSYSC